MFRRLFACARVAVATVLLAGFSVGQVALPHADYLGSAACDPLPIQHDESAHRMRSAAPASDGHAQHCVLCHWSRGSWSLVPTGEHVQQHPGSLESLHASLVLSHGRVGWSFRPGRAPPA
jgi:hypothetical protein